MNMDEIKRAIGTKSGIAGLVALAVPLINPWLVSKGWPSFLDAGGNVSVLSFALAGAWMIFNRAAIAKSKAK